MGPARTARSIVGLMALLAAGCTASSQTSSTGSLAPSPSAAPPPSATIAPPPETASKLPGSLLIVTGDGGLTTMRPDATADRVVVEVEDGAVEVQDAVWSPDGRRIAWSQIDVEDGAPATRVVIADPRGGSRAEAQLASPAFYLSWDPTSSRVAILTGTGPSITLSTIEREGGEAVPLGRGEPFYLSWAPDGDRLVTHVGASGLDEVDVMEGAATRLDETAELQAPAWSADGRTITYARATDDEGSGELVVRDTATDRVRSLADVEGAVFLALSPDGRRVAFHGRPAVGVDPGELGVRVVDLDGSGEVRATSQPAYAWSWSPDGERLAVLEPESGPDNRFHWTIWSDGDSFTTPSFAGTPGLVQRAQYFTQYVQSSTIWSPDGRAIAYPATAIDGRSLIWVQPVREGAAPFPVAEGAKVSWSPAA
jgi:Tol biopolymer transport system component